MAIRGIAQLKSWFKRGKYPTEEQFADWLDSFFHKEDDKIPISSVEQLADRLNRKYDSTAGKELERKHNELSENFSEHKTAANKEFENIYGNIKDLEQEDEKIWGDIDVIHQNISDLQETDATIQESLVNAHNDIGIIREMLKTGATLSEAKTALVELGSNYKDLYAVANTLKIFLESSDTADATINTWQEIEAFLQDITDTQSLTALLAALETNITSAYNNAIIAAVATEKERAENAEADLEERILQSQSAILLDTTLTEEEINAQMSNILQAFLKNPAIQVVIKANVPIEEGTTVSAWFNYVMINHQEQVIDETNTQHWLVLTAGATMNATSVYIGITATAMNGTVANTDIQISNTPFLTDDWSDMDIPEGIPSENDEFLFNDGTKNKKITTGDLVDNVLIPNIKVGGTNLISQSVFGSCAWVENYENGYYTINQQIAFSQTEVNGKDLFGLSGKYKQNTQYSLSGEGQCLTTGNKGLIIYVIYTDGTQDSIREAFPSDPTSFSYTTAKGKTVSRFKASFYDTEGDKTKVKIKLEESNIVSAWSPAPEDFVPFIDYTSLTEQIVPGEFWLDENGTKKQVYIRTFYLTGSLSENSGTAYHYLSNVPSSLIPINYIGNVNIGGFVTSIPYSFHDALRGTSTDVATIFNNGTNVVFYLFNGGRKGAEYKALLTIKYFKNE